MRLSAPELAGSECHANRRCPLWTGGLSCRPEIPHEKRGALRLRPTNEVEDQRDEQDNDEHSDEPVAGSSDSKHDAPPVGDLHLADLAKLQTLARAPATPLILPRGAPALAQSELGSSAQLGRATGRESSGRQRRNLGSCQQ